jgi:hypothetical protein
MKLNLFDKGKYSLAFAANGTLTKINLAEKILVKTATLTLVDQFMVHAGTPLGGTLFSAREVPVTCGPSFLTCAPSFPAENRTAQASNKAPEAA